MSQRTICSRPRASLVARPARVSMTTCFCTATKLIAYIRASAGTDVDLTGILEVEKADKLTPYEQLAELRGITEEEVARQSTENAIRLFALPDHLL